MHDSTRDISREVDRFLRYLAVERGVSGNTLAAYRRDLRAYMEFLERRGYPSVGDVTTADIEAWSVELQHRDPPLAASSVARMLSTVRSAHRFWYDDGVTAQNPAADAQSPKRGMRLPKALSIHEVERLLDAPSAETTTGIRDRAFLEFLYSTGARISEAISLPLDAVTDTDADADLVRLIGKGNKERIVPIGSYARAALDAYTVRVRPGLAAKGKSRGMLFLGRLGQPLSRQSGWNIVRQAAHLAGLTKPISPHTLRHSFATHLLNGGADIRIVQELLGHASVTTTQLYTLVTKESLQEVYRSTHPRS